MDRDEERNRMVEDQLIRRGIVDASVLRAFRKVPRHLFVPPSARDEAYMDCPLPIGHGQTISQPYMVALMTEVLCAGGRDKILEIGTGSGYQAAVLAETCREVYTIERKEHLLDNARETLSGAGYGNIFFKCADGTKGWEEKAPFDGIIVTAAAPGIPESLKDQLADGGRLVMPVGPRFSQVLVAVDREGSSFTEENICGCVFVPLIGDEGCDG